MHAHRQTQMRNGQDSCNNRTGDFYFNDTIQRTPTESRNTLVVRSTQTDELRARHTLLIVIPLRKIHTNKQVVQHMQPRPAIPSRTVPSYTTTVAQLTHSPSHVGRGVMLPLRRRRPYRCRKPTAAGAGRDECRRTGGRMRRVVGMGGCGAGREALVRRARVGRHPSGVGRVAVRKVKDGLHFSAVRRGRMHAAATARRRPHLARADRRSVLRRRRERVCGSGAAAGGDGGAHSAGKRRGHQRCSHRRPHLRAHTMQRRAAVAVVRAAAAATAFDPVELEGLDSGGGGVGSPPRPR